MADFGIRISKDGFDANILPTDSTKKNFVYLSEESSPKVYYAGFLEGESELVGVSYTHNLGYVPLFFLFATDSATTPTFYRAAGSNASATTTTITGNLMQYAYLIILVEGSA